MRQPSWPQSSGAQRLYSGFSQQRSSQLKHRPLQQMRRVLAPSCRLLSNKVGKHGLLRVAAAEAGRAAAAAASSAASTARAATGKAAAAVQIQQSMKRQKKQKKKQQHAAVRASLEESHMCRVSAALMGSSHYTHDLAALLREQFGVSAVMPMHETEGAVHWKLLPESPRTSEHRRFAVPKP